MRFMGSCLILLGVLTFFTGCGVREGEVSGTVLVDADQPLHEGEIIFEEADKSKTPGAGSIKDGKYTV